jgi:hypothetical protein
MNCMSNSRLGDVSDGDTPCRERVITVPYRTQGVIIDSATMAICTGKSADVFNGDYLTFFIQYF